MNQSKPVKIMFSAGESSGDHHAASVFLELKKTIPDLQCVAMGGPYLREAGADVRIDSTGIAVMGVSEVLANYFKIRRVLKEMQQLVRDEKPDLLVCVDYKEFNVRLAKNAKAAGIKVLFYVSPQVWAWRPGRVKAYGRAIDAMAVLFPFEVPFYEKHNIPCRYVGHPAADTVKPSITREEAKPYFGVDDNSRLVGLLPGSRGEEIRRLLPMMLQAAEKIHGAVPNTQFFLVKAKSIDDTVIDAALEQTQLPIRVIRSETHNAILACDAVITSSGTATLEIAILGVPMVITYKLAGWTYWIARVLVSVKFIGLPNIIANRSIVKEFIQYEATPENISAEIVQILTNKDYREHMEADLLQVSQDVGNGGGVKNLANMILELIKL